MSAKKAHKGFCGYSGAAEAKGMAQGLQKHSPKRTSLLELYRSRDNQLSLVEDDQGHLSLISPARLLSADVSRKFSR